MVATVNLPGSSHFAYFVGTKKECEEWLEQKKQQYQERHGGVWWGCYAPARIIGNKEARTWKYRDGNRVIKGI